MKGILIMLFVILLIGQGIATCSDEQIDINSASKEELDKLYGVGPVKAEAIINFRANEQFQSIDDLIKVNGIGEVTLNKIKEKKQACVESEIENNEVEEETESNDIEEESELIESSDEGWRVGQEPTELQTISLNTKTIKSDDDNEDTSNYAIYGFIGFCILLAILLLIKRNRFNKNEFR